MFLANVHYYAFSLYFIIVANTKDNDAIHFKAFCSERIRLSTRRNAVAQLHSGTIEQTLEMLCHVYPV